jgi:predicted patatin/cPLA2 family phospholipase
MFLHMNALSVLLLSALLVGCGGNMVRKSAVPENQHIHAQVAQVQESPGVRYMITSPEGITAMINDLRESQQRVGVQNIKGTGSYLSISGGGDNGAFGAGLLAGWTKRGDRPVFNLVTGVSTGALIAPFAYLGPQYDDVLQYVYTQVTPDMIFKKRGLMAAVFEDSIGDTTPLYQLISQHVDADFLKKVATEYRERGRWLLVGTTNIDAGVPVIWNMGKIAAIGTPEALELFKRVMLASASIPGAFPPVLFDAVLNGESYHEMHVDGGASTQVFLYPSAAAEKAREEKVVRRKNLQAYIIRNSRLDNGWQEIERKTMNIVGRSISQLIQAQGIGDIYRIYQTTQRDHVGFNLAFIGSDFREPHHEEFDTQYMRALYQYAYDQTVMGYPWLHEPPGLTRTIDEDVRAADAGRQKSSKALSKGFNKVK